MKLLTRLLPLVLLVPLLAACEVQAPEADDEAAADTTAATGPSIHAASDVEAGRYYVVVAGCNDCHTPGWLQEPGSAPEAQWLTGLPIGFRGPWGTSYPKNLRLRAQELTEDDWVALLHTLDALPPMPSHAVNHLSEQDARSLYRYIRSLGPAGQPAPQAVPPGQEPTTPYFDFTPQHMERMPSMPPGTPPPPSNPRNPE